MIKWSQLNRAKIILFSVLALLTIYVLVDTELRFVLNKSPESERLKSMSWILIPHVFFAAIALTIGPFQFSSNIRSKNAKLHRKIGKLYLISILLSVPFSILLPIYYPMPGANITFKFVNITQASVWGITALLAWIAATKRQISLHKIWAARSYGVTCIFVLSRLYDPTILFIASPTRNDFGFFLFFLIVLALVLPDIFLFYKELFGFKKSKPRTQPTTSGLAQAGATERSIGSRNTNQL